METPSLSPKPAQDFRSSVDTSRPFRSVKEAVAIFGDRILSGEIYSPKPYYTPRPSSYDHSWMFSSPSSIHPSKEDDDLGDNNNNNNDFLDTLKKLQAELEQTKTELKLLKERESETEIAVASLNAELHKNMAKLAAAEAVEAKKAASEARRVSFEREKIGEVIREEKKKRELIMRMENSPTLANFLSISEEKEYYGGKKERKKKMTKKKPIISLVGDWFFRKKKGSSDKTLNNNPLFASVHGVF